MPASFGIFYTRYCVRTEIVDGERKQVFDIPDDRFFELLAIVVGDDLAEMLSKSQMGFEFILDQIMRPVMQIWGLEVSGDTASVSGKNEPTPAS